jgi:L-threonylcarbamoyladenylate synthase
MEYAQGGLLIQIVVLNPESPRDDRLSRAVDVMRRGGIVSLPTETFYGLAADASNREALARLNGLKGKPFDSPILLLLADAGQISQVAADLPDSFETMAKTFWPGPLSLVVPAREGVPEAITGGRGTVAVRVPGLALPRRLADALGGPVTGVSANRTTRPPCRTASEVCRVFPEGVDMILDGGPSTGGAPSTVLDLTASPPAILREGAIPASALRPFLSCLRIFSV